ncbi:hypothetical protein [Crocinitomix catalasitica]|uniref:hypothetical protein n=1 Tax=Crocinitomix catalasitica TaxID=184607 RepID=UPI00048017A1|nr:hypothetical protein [Crocinitomix catalasitica]
MRTPLIINKLKFTFCLIFAFSLNSFANFSIEGRYQGKGIYVQSPSDQDGFGFCISKVSINGTVIPVDIYSSAFEIDPSAYNYNVGDKIFIVFEHEAGCKPKLLNPEVLLPTSTFMLTDMSCAPSGQLSWATTDESGQLDFIIEQFKWNKWVVVGQVLGNGIPSLNYYTFDLIPHSGENTIRVSQIDNTGKKRIAQEIKFISSNTIVPKLTKSTTNKQLLFTIADKSTKTKFEIFDNYGNIIKKGYNNLVDYSNFKKGVYYINYDNKNEKIFVD